MDKNGIITRADELISIAKGRPGGNLNHQEIEQILFGSLSLIKYCYGENSKQFEILYNIKKLFGQITLGNYEFQAKTTVIGILTNLKSDIDLGLIISIEKQTAGEIFTDMLSLSKKLIDEGYKESSAVLASGAFEDSMKKFGHQNGLDVKNADLTDVINALKSRSIIKSIQANVAQSHVPLRNKAFHAQWDKIDVPEIKSLIAFLEEFILKNFESAI